MKAFYYGFIKPLFVKAGLLGLIDAFAYAGQHIRFYKQNRMFKKEHPDFVLPPNYMLYEAYQLNYKQYFEDSREAWICQQVPKDYDWENKRVLEWGCGPARLIRELPHVLNGKKTKIFASDYNPNTIHWCQTNIKGITFLENNTHPPIKLEDNSIDLIYSVSVFTHLNEALHEEWLNEHNRLLKEKGLLVFTFHGDAFLRKIPQNMQEVYKNGSFVEVKFPKMGHRIYAAFMPLTRMLFWLEKCGFEVIEHKQGKDYGTWISQDLLICKKKIK